MSSASSVARASAIKPLTQWPSAVATEPIPNGGVTEDVALQQGLTTIGKPGIQVAAISKRPRGCFIIHVDGGEDRKRVPLVNGEPTGFKSRQLAHGDRGNRVGVPRALIVPGI